MELDAAEIRVLGCLIEKQRTTPDSYPLTLNALRAACNQSTNRDPVVDYDEETIRAALGSLGRRRWVRSAFGHTSRTPKYRHLLDSELGLSDEELSLLAVLMLRGAQTPGQLRQRSERLYRFADNEELHTTLERLIERGLVARLPRRPGQKEERYEHRLGDGEEEADEIAAPAAGEADGSLAARVAALERELAALRERVDALAGGGPGSP